MRAGSGYGTFACWLAILLSAGSIFAGTVLAAVPEAEPPLLLAQATDTAEEPEPPPVSSTPDSFTATYGDWQLRCLRNTTDPAATALACEVVTFVVAEGQQQPFAQIALSKGADGATHITAVVPVNVLVRTQPIVATDEADAGLTVPWLTCTPNGCAADQALADADLERFRAYTRQGRLVFTDSVGNEVTVLFSFRGLAQALDALTAEMAK
jgi:invasion protein IalB